jgi:hypothetical protein
MSLEGPQCAGVGLVPSGLSAISTTLLSVLKAGEHLLVTDNVYRPSRNFCNGMLTRYGFEVAYFDPLTSAGIEKLFKPNTRAVLVEAPGSQSFEMTDIPRHIGGGARAGRARYRRQHLGDAAASPLARSGRRHLDAGRHQIYRRPFRHHVRHDLGQRQSLATACRRHPPARRLRRPR